MQNKESRLSLRRSTHAVSVRAVDTARVLAREGSSDRMGGKKKKRCDTLKGASHQLAHQAHFQLSGEKITHNETKTRASETHAKEQSRSVQSEP